MRIFVTGCNGQLGKSLQQEAENSPHEYIFTDIDDVDITDKEAVELCVKVNDFDVIVNCAAYTDVGRAEYQEDIAMNINARGAGYLARAARDAGIPLIHISCADVVAGAGQDSPYTESARHCPAGVIGLTKLQGEEAVTKSGCRYIILRTSWLYSEDGKNFVTKLVDKVRAGNEVRLPVDFIGTPTYARDLARAIVKIIDGDMIAGHEGVYNYCDCGVSSLPEIAKEIVKSLGNHSIQIIPDAVIPEQSWNFAAVYSALDNTAFMTEFKQEIPDWQESLSEALVRMKRGISEP